MSEQAGPPASDRFDITWRIRHSAWLLAVLLGAGSLSFVGFLYCAIRIKSPVWWKRAGVISALSLIGLIMLLAWTGDDGEAHPVAAGYAALLWMALLAYGLVVNREYLAWRAEQSPPRRPHKRQVPQLQPFAPAPPYAQPAPPYANPQPFAPTPPDAQPAPNAVQPPAVMTPEDRRAAAAAASELRAVLEDPELQAWGSRPGEGASQRVAETFQPGSRIDTWQEAEALAAWHMGKLGFDDAELTPTGADGGIDVRSPQAAAQVKHYSAPVGGPAVQQLRGAAYGHDLALFYALSGYTRAAVEYAESANVALFRYDSAGRITPITTTAKVLQDRAGDPSTFDIAEFEQQLAGQRLGQQAFDAATQEFFAVTRQAIALGERDRRAPAYQAMKVELEQVRAHITYLSARKMPLRELLASVGQIEAATARLRAYVAAPN